MSNFRVLPLLSALLAVLMPLLLAQQVGKLPDEPWLGSLPEMYANLAFVMALGLHLPYPRVMAALFLIFSAWMGYRLARRWTG